MIGELEPSVRYDWASKHSRDVGYISNMRDPAGNPIGGLGTNEVVWHTDQSYLARPVTGAMLYCVETPPDRSEEHTSELQSLMRISYAVFCLKKKKKNNITYNITDKN